MDEKRFSRRDDAPADRSADKSPVEPEQHDSGLEAEQPLPRLDPESRAAGPDPAPQASPPRRMPVLGATPTALPTNLRVVDRDEHPGAERHATNPPRKSTPEAASGPVTDAGRPRRNGDRPTTNGDRPARDLDGPATNGDRPAAVEDGPATNGDRPATDGDGQRAGGPRSNGFWSKRFRPGPATIPPQRQPEPEPSVASTRVEEPPTRVTEESAQEAAEEPRAERPAPSYVDERPAARYVDERPAPSYVDDRPAARYVDEPAAPSYVDEPRPETGGEQGGGSGKEPGGVKGAWARRPTSVTLNWKSLGVILLVIGVVFWLAKGFIGGPPAPQSTPETKAGQKVAVPKEKTHLKRVVIDGNRIRAAGPLITLNPALAQPGAMVTVAGSGFDPGNGVDIVLSTKGNQTGTSLGSARTDRTGNLNAQVTIPDTIQGGTVIITAKERNSNKIATAEAATAAGMGFAKISKNTGKPGDTISVSARGFAPGEKINVYWGRASGKPTSTIQASESGTVSQAPIRVGVGQVGEATLVLVGAKSGTTATVPFYMLGLYPTAKTSPYALKAGDDLSLSASGFAPDERVMVYVNEASGTPAMSAQTDAQGNLGGIGFKVPFGLQGSQSIVMVGEQSRASVSSGFEVLPYTPSAQTSTYGGSPGTSFSFFAKGFAPNEVVLVYLGRTKWDAGELVSAFRVNDQGSAGAAGSFQITTADSGTLNFTLIGRKSGGKASTSLKVSPATGPVDNMPPRPKYVLPKNLRH